MASGVSIWRSSAMAKISYHGIARKAKRRNLERSSDLMATTRHSKRSSCRATLVLGVCRAARARHMARMKNGSSETYRQSAAASTAIENQRQWRQRTAHDNKAGDAWRAAWRGKT